MSKKYLDFDGLSHYDSKIKEVIQKDLADKWTPSTSYAVGKYVVNNGLLYKCITAHTSSAAFNTDSSKWSQVKVSDFIGIANVAGTSPVLVSIENKIATVSLSNYYGDVKNPYNKKGAHLVLAGNGTDSSDAAPSFRALTQDDLPSIASSKISDLSNTYSSSGTVAVTGKAIAAALGTLDVSNITGFGAGKTLASLSETDGKISATFQDISITLSQVSGLETALGGKQPLDADLTAIAGLSGTGFLKRTGDNTWALDTMTGAMRFVGVSTTDPTSTSGATVSGHSTWSKGDVVLYNKLEYVNTTGSNTSSSTPNPNWEELGDGASYALKTTTISAGVGLSGGGNLSANRTLKVNLVNETASTNAATYEAGGTSKFYAVQLDKNNKLGVYVPWSNSTSYLSYTATATTDTDAINYILGKQTVSANAANYYNSDIYFKAGNLYSESFETKANQNGLHASVSYGGLTVSNPSVSSTSYTNTQILMTVYEGSTHDDYVLALPLASGTLALETDVQFSTVTLEGGTAVKGVTIGTTKYNFGVDVVPASSSVAGIVKLGSDTTQTGTAAALSSTNGRTYLVQNNANGQLVVNVPWSNSTSYLSYTATATTDTDAINYILGKQTVSANAANYYNSDIYFKGSTLFASGGLMCINSSSGSVTSYGPDMIMKVVGQSSPTFYQLTLPSKTDTLAVLGDILQSDWNQTTTTAKDYIKNKPTIPATNVIPAINTAGKILVSTTTSGTAKWSDYSTAGLLKTSNTGVISVDTSSYVIGSGLTANCIVVGNGTVNIKSTVFKPGDSATTWDSDSNIYLPTMKSISNRLDAINITNAEIDTLF